MSTGSGEKERVKRARRESRSLFGPIVLIAIGFGFLFYNLDLLPGLNWTAVFWLWPFLLIFLGLDLLLRQFGPPLGSLLSGVVAICAVGFFAWVLLGNNSDALLAGFGLQNTAELQREQISFAADDVRQANVSIQFASQPAEVFALDDSNQLIDGSVSYRGDLVFDAGTAGGTATINLDTQDNFPFMWLEGGQFVNPSEEDEWQIGLGDAVPLDLSLDAASGPVDLDLSRLRLQSLDLDGGSGSMNVRLPDGDYEAAVDVSSGAANLAFAEGGDQRVTIEGGSGAMVITIPADKAVRVELDGGSGPVAAMPQRYRRLSGEQAGEGVWQSEGYDLPGESQLTLLIDVASGPLTIREQ